MSAAEIAGPVPDDVQSLTPSERKVYYRHLMISLVDNLTCRKTADGDGGEGGGGERGG